MRTESNVRCWHLTDVSSTVANVCYRGKSRLSTDLTKQLLLIQSRNILSSQAETLGVSFASHDWSCTRVGAVPRRCPDHLQTWRRVGSRRGAWFRSDVDVS